MRSTRPSLTLRRLKPRHEAYVARVESEYPDLEALQRETAAWWQA